ncbi:MAG: hypothetical protein QXU11_03430 [Thermoproteota archaeon]
MGFEATLLKPDGSFVDANITRVGENLIVRVRGEGLLNINLVTPSFETIGASVRLEKACEVETEEGKKSRRVDISFVKKAENEKEVPYIVIEVKTGVETHVEKGTLEQVEIDAYLVKKHGCTAYYYFNQAPSEKGAMQYLGKIRQVYLKEELYGKMFVIIGGGEPVEPTDSSLDAYILEPPGGR